MMWFVLYVMLASWREPFPVKVAEFPDRQHCEAHAKAIEDAPYNGAPIEQWECVAVWEEKGEREEIDEK
jgi:hypothetical protein